VRRRGCETRRIALSLIYQTQLSTLHYTTDMQSAVVERLPAERTARVTTGFEPLEQTPAVEQVSTSLASLIWQFAIRAYYAVANRTLALPLHRTVYVSLESRQSVNEGPVEHVYRAQ
jgi:hypothetical protein